jgi:metallophosphoesterase superfamily enzyme
LLGTEFEDSHNAIENLRQYISKNRKSLEEEASKRIIREKVIAPPLSEDEIIPDYMKDKILPKEDITTENNRVLVIADLHIPFEKEGYFEWCVDVYAALGCNKVIIIGDEIDSNSISFHPKNPDLYSPKDELELAKSKLRRWYEKFPDAVVLNGNHTNLIKRKIADAGLPSQVMRPLNEILEVPNWKYYDEYIHNGILYIHGTGLTSNSVEKKVMYSQLPVVMGHLHSVSRIQYYTANLFSMVVGCGCDSDALAFEYSKTNPKPSIVACGVIADKTPVLFTL